MLGSTFIAEDDLAKLAELNSVDDLDDFVHVDLDRMLSLDFVQMLPPGVDWDEGEPVLFDEAEGVSLTKISEIGLNHVLTHPDECPDEHQKDLQKLTKFVEMHGKSSIYEFATF